MSQNDTRGSRRAATAAPGTTATRGGRGLRPNAFAAVVILLIQYGLGMWINLYAKIPASDHGKGIFAAFGAAVANGPVALALHALLGTLLLATATALVVRAVAARKTATTAISAVALLAVIAAWLSGARFVGDAANGASFGMALGAGVALLCYVIVLSLPRLTEGPAGEPA